MSKEVFRNALQNSSANRGDQNHGENFNLFSGTTYKNMLNKIAYTNIGWAFITSLVIFITLFILNPPITQEKSEHDLTTSRPNIKIIGILSLLSGVVVYILSKCY